jgi:hypothetical protein
MDACGLVQREWRAPSALARRCVIRRRPADAPNDCGSNKPHATVRESSNLLYDLGTSIIAVLSGSPDIDKRLRTLFRVAQRLNQLRKKLAGENMMPLRR